ncbi:MAG: hypothetical protein R2696_16880 [Microthrixaceae bacterium]
MLDDAAPDVVVLLSGLFLFESIAFEICTRRGIEVVSYERAFRENTLVYAADWGRRPLRLQRAVGQGEPSALLGGCRARRLPGGSTPRRGVRPVLDDRGRARGGRRPHRSPWSPGGAVHQPDLDSAVVGRDLALSSIREWLDVVVEEFGRRPSDRLVIRSPSETHLPGKVTRDSLDAYPPPGPAEQRQGRGPR